MELCSPKNLIKLPYEKVDVSATIKLYWLLKDPAFCFTLFP